MPRSIVPLCACLVLTVTAIANAQAAAPPQRTDSASRARVPASALAGTWRSAAEEMRLTTPFDESVWGANAKSVRTVELRLQPSGEGTLTITKKVVDARGRTIAASTSVEEARLAIGESRPGVSTRVEHDVKVLSAVRTYPDDPGYKWELAGLRVQVVTFGDEDGNTLELRVDTPDGRGSFWETLHRDGGTGRQSPQRSK